MFCILFTLYSNESFSELFQQIFINQQRKIFDSFSAASNLSLPFFFLFSASVFHQSLFDFHIANVFTNTKRKNCSVYNVQQKELKETNQKKKIQLKVSIV